MEQRDSQLPPPRDRRAARSGRLVAIILTAVFGVTACGAGAPLATRSPIATSVAPSATPAPTAPAPITAAPRDGAPTPIETAPDSARVDLEKPAFSDPTSITNPLFPRVGITQMIELGAEAADKLRFEVTLLPDIKVIEWDGQSIETRVTHFMAYSNGRILEVALDFYAQADDGSVWYFGEDVYNYEDGVVANNEGTWLAGKDGPPGMIMPADPKVGDVYRPENIPGLVFEEVTVQAVEQTVDGPRGPVAGAVFVQEHLMDGTIEDKVFAPGYGEFQAQVVSLDELYGVAFAAPIDALSGAVPAEIASISSGAEEIMSSSTQGDWNAIPATLGTMTEGWRQYRPTGVPERLDVQMADALDSLTAAVDARDAEDARQAAVGVAQASLDFELRYRPIVDVDLDRLNLWSNQLQLDIAAADGALVLGDVAVLEAIWDRVDHAVDSVSIEGVDAALVSLRAAANAADMAMVRDALAAFRAALHEAVPTM